MTRREPDDPNSASAHRRPAARPTDALTIAAASALVAALGHVAYTESRFRLLHIFTWTSREFVWLSTVGYLTIFLVLALPLAAAAPLVPRGRAVRLLVAGFMSLAVWALLLLAPRVHPLASVMLAVGIASQIARWAGRDVARTMRLSRRWIGGAVAALVVAGITLGAWSRISERFGSARRPQASPDAPNVILLILDTVRAANLSAYGYPRATSPVLERVAREGVLFAHAFATAPWTAPSHASMMTGHWPSATGAGYLRPMVDTLPTLAEVLRGAGYATGGFVANTGYAGYQVGIDRGFVHFEDFPATFQEALWSTTLTQTGSGRLLVEGLREGSRWKVLNAIRRFDLRVVGVRRSVHQPAAVIASRFLAWREGVGAGPYFAMLNFMDAHAPYEPPGRFRTAFNGGRQEIDRYDGGIAYADSIIGMMLERLEARGELDRTLLVVTSDHGEQWGEHGMFDHGNSLYRTALHVPLIVRAPGRVPAGLRVQAPVSLRDVAATVAQLAGLPNRFPGASLAAAWTPGMANELSPVVAEVEPTINPGPNNRTRTGELKAAIDSSWYYILSGDGSEELFRWRSGQDDGPNVAQTAPGREVAARLRTVITRALGLVPLSVVHGAGPD